MGCNVRYGKCFLIINFLWVLSIPGFTQQSEIDSLLNILPKAVYAEQRIDLLNALAFAYAPVSVLEAEKYGNEAIQKAREISYKTGLAESFKIFGLIHYVRSEYHVAAEYSYQSLKLYEEMMDKRGEYKVLNNLGMIMLAQKEYGRAYDFTIQSLRLKRQAGDSLGVANSLLSLTEYYLYTGEYDKALSTCRTALACFKLYHDDSGKSHALFNIGEIFFFQKKYAQASPHYHIVIRMAKISNDQIQLINAHKQLGKLFLESQQFDSAYFYLHKTVQLAHEQNNRINEMEAREFLAAYFQQKGRLDSALYYARTAAAIEREMYALQKREQIATLQMLYDFNKQEQELGFQKKIVRRQYAVIAAVSLILILSVLFGTRIYALNKSNHRAKEELLKLNNEIKQINENLEGIVQDRTDEITSQNQKLIDYTFFIAHEVRGPLARILGLIELFKIKDLADDDKNQIMVRLENTSIELDEIISKVNRNLEGARSK